MPDFRPMTCFYSYSNSSPRALSIHQEISKVCQELGLRTTLGGGMYNPGGTIRQGVQRAIDESFAVIVEVSDVSWWVAYELFCAVGRKICIPLAPRERPVEPGAEGLASVYPELPQIRYIPHGIPEESLEIRLEAALRVVLGDAARWSTQVSEESLKAYTSRESSKYVAPTLEVNGNPTEHGTLFNEWLAIGKPSGEWLASGKPLRAVVIAAPGSGKTRLLTMFAQAVLESSKGRPKEADELSPVVIFLPATALPPGGRLLDLIRRKVFEWEPSDNQDHRSNLAHPGLFESYRLAGRIFVLVDGLDEFIVRRRDEVYHLFKELQGLREECVHLVASCRENSWAQQSSATGDYTVVRILPFNQTQAEELLEGVVIPISARNEQGEIKEFLLNPLLLGFIRELASHNPRVAFKTRTDLYEAWAKEGLGTEKMLRFAGKSKHLLNFYGTIAIELLQRREKTLKKAFTASLLKAFPSLDVGLDDLMNSEVLRRCGSDKQVEFAHESIYEFFLARALQSDFTTAIKAKTPVDELLQLSLAKVELDYPQSSVYGFLTEMLPTFSADLRAGLRQAAASPTQSWQVLRNLVEFVGMTHHTDGLPAAESKDLNRLVVYTLMEIAENQKLAARVRYNALRALERVHPCAPRPYFAHVSDWGLRDRQQLIAIMDRPLEDRPWVMVGHRQKEPQPGRHWAWIPNNGENPDHELQREISGRLAQLLEQLLSSFCDAGLPINASHAWIRWYDDDHRADRDRVLPNAMKLDHPATDENLRRFVGLDASAGGA